MGAKKKPFYRVVVADSRCARDGRFIESIGTYDPNLDPPAIKLNNERVEHWLSNGARPSDTARALLKIAGFLGGAAPKPEKAAPVSKKGKAKAAAEAAAPAAEAPAPEAPAAEALAVEEAPVEEPKAEAAVAEEAPAEEPKAEEAPAETEATE